MMYVDQYWETSDPDYPLVLISWVFESDPPGFCPEGRVPVTNIHKRWAMKREHLIRPSGKGPDETIEKVRKIQATMNKCDPECPGWGVFTVSGCGGDREHDLEIQCCDDCNQSINNTGIGDLHYAALPEAQAELAKEYEHEGS